MNYKITFGEAPIEVFSAMGAVVVATNALEAMRCAVRQCERKGNSYDVLAEDGGNIYSGNHFLVRVSDARGVICVVPATAKPIQTIAFPA